jgi:hypothetical protein
MSRISSVSSLRVSGVCRDSRNSRATWVRIMSSILFFVSHVSESGTVAVFEESLRLRFLIVQCDECVISLILIAEGPGQQKQRIITINACEPGPFINFGANTVISLCTWQGQGGYGQ